MFTRDGVVTKHTCTNKGLKIVPVEQCLISVLVSWKEIGLGSEKFGSAGLLIVNTYLQFTIVQLYLKKETPFSRNGFTIQVICSLGQSWKALQDNNMHRSVTITMHVYSLFNVQNVLSTLYDAEDVC